MPDETPIAFDHPMKLAWDKYKGTDEYANTRRWALHEAHVDGSLWAAFNKGWMAHAAAAPGKDSGALRSAMTTTQNRGECGCVRCQQRRAAAIPDESPEFFRKMPGADPFFRYACEICGNKRCPHHTDHTLACTGSNDAGQPGSDWV